MKLHFPLYLLDKMSITKVPHIVPDNIQLFHIPPYTPEMNLIEQVWREIRTRGFKNEVFQTLEDVINRLCKTIRSLTKDVIRSITGRDWILSLF